MEAHTKFSHNLGLIAIYIMDIRPEVAVESDKLKRDAKEALDETTKDEKIVRDKVSTWKKNNRKWMLRPKKKEKSKERGESMKTDNQSGKARWLENLARDLKPSSNLKDDGDLRAMKLWKQAMQSCTGYIRKEFELTPDLYYDVFMNLCEPEMRKKLDGVKSIKEMGEARIWEIIEGIWVESNPM